MSQMTLERIHEDLLALSEKLKNSELNNLAYEIKTYILDKDEKKAVKGWKKDQGKIVFAKNKTIKIEVYKNKEYPGIMIHRRYGAEEQLESGWVISHELSGSKISQSFYTSVRKAVKAFLDHAAKVNWNRPAAEISEDPEAKKAYSDLNK